MFWPWPTQETLAVSPGSTWEQVDQDTTHRVMLTTYRCRACRRLCVSTSSSAPTSCCCEASR